jgi:hypothetical protein
MDAQMEVERLRALEAYQVGGQLLCTVIALLCRA